MLCCSGDFYPRPPRGGRRGRPVYGVQINVISIHALREEGDAAFRVSLHRPIVFSIHAVRVEGDYSPMQSMCQLSIFLSTPSARRATISLPPNFTKCFYFYPRPPRGGRQFTTSCTTTSKGISIHALREEGDLILHPMHCPHGIFLSTPSARRATISALPSCIHSCISIHALREEGDGLASSSALGVSNFYPRPPRGGRQQKQRENTLLLSHYTPLCTNCKEMSAKQTAKSHRYLRKRLVFRCEASRKTMCAADSHWPDIKRSARCLGQILGAVQRARPSSGSCCPAGRTADCPRRGRSGRSALL